MWYVTFRETSKLSICSFLFDLFRNLLNFSYRHHRPALTDRHHHVIYLRTIVQARQDQWARPNIASWKTPVVLLRRGSRWLKVVSSSINPRRYSWLQMKVYLRWKRHRFSSSRLDKSARRILLTLGAAIEVAAATAVTMDEVWSLSIFSKHPVRFYRHGSPAPAPVDRTQRRRSPSMISHLHLLWQQQLTYKNNFIEMPKHWLLIISSSVCVCLCVCRHGLLCCAWRERATLESPLCPIPFPSNGY